MRLVVAALHHEWQPAAAASSAQRVERTRQECALCADVVAGAACVKGGCHCLPCSVAVPRHVLCHVAKMLACESREANQGVDNGWARPEHNEGKHSSRAQSSKSRGTLCWGPASSSAAAAHALACGRAVPHDRRHQRPLRRQLVGWLGPWLCGLAAHHGPRQPHKLLHRPGGVQQRATCSTAEAARRRGRTFASRDQQGYHRCRGNRCNRARCRMCKAPRRAVPGRQAGMPCAGRPPATDLDVGVEGVGPK